MIFVPNMIKSFYMLTEEDPNSVGQLILTYDAKKTIIAHT